MYNCGQYNLRTYAFCHKWSASILVLHLFTKISHRAFMTSVTRNIIQLRCILNFERFWTYREKSIKEFNKPQTEAFIFLLSIRAAGRGLNLQTADTVIIYDPDPNPKNEEQAIARSHRIGQTREVRVFHFEAVADAESSVTAEVSLHSFLVSLIMCILAYESSRTWLLNLCSFNGQFNSVS